MAQTNASAVAQMRRIMDLESTIDVTRSSEIADQIAEKILAAETADAVFDAAEIGLETSESLLGIPLRILRISYNKTGFDQGLPVYTVVTSVDANGIEHVWSIGGSTAQTQLFRWNQAGHLPIVAVLVEKGSQSSPGNSVRLFRRPTRAELKTFPD